MHCKSKNEQSVQTFEVPVVGELLVCSIHLRMVDSTRDCCFPYMS